jgi:hypothetical protein
MIHRGPGFLADLAPRDPLLPSAPVRKLDRGHTGRLRKRDNLLVGEGYGGGGESDDRKKAWFLYIIQYSLNFPLFMPPPPKKNLYPEIRSS